MANARLWIKHPCGAKMCLGRRMGGEYESYDDTEYKLDMFFKEAWDKGCEEGRGAETQDEFYLVVEW